jgi:hypothetical protein
MCANRKMGPEEKDNLDITKNDFMNGGKYMHLFMLKYQCVPTQIMLEHGLSTDRI